MDWREDLRNTIRLEAVRAVGRLAMPRVGLISSYNETEGPHTVKVTFPEDTDANGVPLETGWIPNAPLWSGQGWGLFAAPVVGSQVVVNYIGGNPDCGYVACHLASRVSATPSVPSGELWLVHQSGSFIKLTNDGAVNVQNQFGVFLRLASTGEAVLQDQAGSYLALTNDGNALLSVANDLKVTGGIEIYSGTPQAFQIGSHNHTQPNDSHGDTEQPTSAPVAGS